MRVDNARAVAKLEEGGADALTSPSDDDGVGAARED